MGHQIKQIDNTGNSRSIAVFAASVAAELNGVMDVAKGVSLAAKNAKYISAQAGEIAQGFQPITDFINDISEQVIAYVNDINRVALQLSSSAVEEQRARNAFIRFRRVLELNAEARHIGSLSDSMSAVSEKLEIYKQQFKKNLEELIELLETLDSCMLSANSIASVSRIVTADTREFHDKLMVVADNLDQASFFIKEKVALSYKHLQQVKSITNQANAG